MVHQEAAACAPVFGVKKAQEYIHRHEGGIIWHTQGSGKSILMVLLAKKWDSRKQTETRA